MLLLLLSTPQVTDLAFSSSARVDGLISVLQTIKTRWVSDQAPPRLGVWAPRTVGGSHE